MRDTEFTDQERTRRCDRCGKTIAPGEKFERIHVTTHIANVEDDMVFDATATGTVRLHYYRCAECGTAE
jgi:hypothetical protein